MTHLRLLIAALLSCLLLAGCQSEPRIEKAEFLVFGTLLDITAVHPNEAATQAAFSDIQAMFRDMHRDWHAWEPGLLTEINAAFAAGQGIAANPEIVTLINRSREIEQLSDGCFNPAIGGLVRLWGFHTSIYPIVGPPPATADIQALVRQQPSTADIRVDGLKLTSENPAVQLDFGGVAKGYAIDLAMERLRDRGIENAIVNAGGDLRVMGARSDRPWRIAIRSPGGGIIGTIETAGDEALFTSGVYERFRADQQERYPHILDPRTGWPVNELTSATVISADGLLADAAATALIVAGRREAFRLASQLGLEQVLVVDEEGTAWLTPQMALRIEFEEGVERQIVPLTGK